MTFTNLLVVAGILILAGQAETNRRSIMGQLEQLQQAVADARTAIEADKQAIIAEIQRLGLPDEDISGVLASVSELGSVLDDVPGVTPATPTDGTTPTDSTTPNDGTTPAEPLPVEGE